MDDLTKMGRVTRHSSEEESDPDVGIEVNIGRGLSLYVGEVGGRQGWSAALSAENGLVPFASITDEDAARDMVDALAATLRALTEKNNG